MEVLKIKLFFEKIRKQIKNVSFNKQIVITLGVILLGFLLGVLQKWIDSTSGSNLPLILQQLDIGNYFGRLAIWILLGTIISVYSESPLRAAINTFMFFISMLAGYYIYCNYILGVLLAQAFNLNITQGFYMYHLLEVITWIIGVLILRRKPKEHAIQIGLSVVIAVIYQLVMPHWG